MTFQSNAPVANVNYSIATGANSNSPFITVFMTRDPTPFDAQYSIKQRWINTVSTSEWILLGFSNVTGETLAVWIEIGEGAIKSTWTPTVDGSTPGVTVYGLQIGSYVKTRYLVQAEFTVTVASATGTGDLKIGGLPFPINSGTSGNVIGSVIIVNPNALVWPFGTTSIALLGQPGTSFLAIFCSGSSSSGGLLQIVNTTMNIQGTIVYEI